MKYGILVTNSYPYLGSDYGFVASEIDAIAAGFDKVYVIPAQRIRGSSLGHYPSNVVLLKSTPADPLFNLLPLLGAGRRPFRTAAAIMGDLKRLQTPTHLRRLAHATSVGISVSAEINKVVRRLGGRFPPIYFFWGAWGAYAIPWISRSHPYMVRIHGGDLYEERSGGYLPFRFKVFERCAKVLAVSNHAANYLNRQPYGPARRAEVVELGSPDVDRMSVHRPSDSIQVVSCSTVDRNKRVNLIAQALIAVARLGVRVNWTHFGNGERMSELRETLQLSPPGLEIQLRGRVGRDEILQYYQSNSVDVFVNASISEGAPVSIMEALSQDIPIVATATGGVPYMEIANEDVGRLVDVAAQPEEFARAILDSAGLRVSSTGARFELWHRRFRAKINSEKTAEIFASLESNIHQTAP